MILRAWKRRERGFRVWLNDEEVTNRCFYVDTRYGMVRLYKLDSDGRKYLVTTISGRRVVAQEERHGKVRAERMRRG